MIYLCSYVISISVLQTEPWTKLCYNGAETNAPYGWVEWNGVRTCEQD